MSLFIITAWLWWIYVVEDRQLICTVETAPGMHPTEAQLVEACKPWDVINGLYFGEIAMEKYVINRDETPPAPFCQPPDVPTGTGLFETPPSAEGLYTTDDLQWLAGRLTWYGRAESVTAWQNQFNVDIFNAARSAGVPAVLLKKLIGVESQYWPLWKPSAGEIGMGQITDAGADVLLRYDDAIFDSVCKSAIARCDRGYHILTTNEQKLIRDVLRATLYCAWCDVDQAIAHERANIIFYSRILRAYGCRNGWDWEAALKDYNGGDDYLEMFGL